jgi:Fe-S cluster biogenesis protein NfuA
METRIAKSVERLQAKLRREGSQVELLAIEDGAVSLRVTPPEHACASTSKTLKASVEDAIYSAAPDIASLVIEGLEGKPASGFVAVEALGGHHTPSVQHITAYNKQGELREHAHH